MDDEDLDSGDDEGRGDRIQDEEDARGAEEEQVEQAIMEAALGRQPVPEPSDGEVSETCCTLCCALPLPGTDSARCT